MAKLRRRDFYFVGEQWSLRFHEKGGKSREIPVRHDLQAYLSEYLAAAGLRGAPKHERRRNSLRRLPKTLVELGGIEPPTPRLPEARKRKK